MNKKPVSIYALVHVLEAVMTEMIDLHLHTHHTYVHQSINLFIRFLSQEDRDCIAVHLHLCSCNYHFGLCSDELSNLSQVSEWKENKDR